MLLDFSQNLILPLLFTTGLIAGTVDAIAGGGGLISLPVLLGVGMPPHLALGTNKLQSTVGTAVATYTYARTGWLKKEGLLVGLICSFFGSLLGATTSQIMSGGTLKRVIPVFLCIILVYTILSPRFGMKDEKPRIKETTFYIIFGSLLGFYDGFLGPGVGSFWMFLLMFFLGHNLAKATAYTKAFNLNTNLAAMSCFAFGHNIDYRIALCMAAGQIIGGRLGAYLTVRNGAKLVRPIFLMMVTATIVTLVYRNYAGFIHQMDVDLFIGFILVAGALLSIILLYLRTAPHLKYLGWIRRFLP
jgi:uncharacterized membrane protein YfcA